MAGNFDQRETAEPSLALPMCSKVVASEQQAKIKTGQRDAAPWSLMVPYLQQMLLQIVRHGIVGIAANDFVVW